jgi:hypothetical protein
MPTVIVYYVSTLFEPTPPPTWPLVGGCLAGWSHYTWLSPIPWDNCHPAFLSRQIFIPWHRYLSQESRIQERWKPVVTSRYRLLRISQIPDMSSQVCCAALSFSHKALDSTKCTMCGSWTHTRPIHTILQYSVLYYNSVPPGLVLITSINLFNNNNKYQPSTIEGLLLWPLKKGNGPIEPKVLVRT